MQYTSCHSRAFSSVMALVMIWFLLTTTIWVFQLVLRELQDNRVLGQYIQTLAGAESAAELALLQIKQNGYGYYERHLFWENSSINHILAEDPGNPTQKDIEISYDINTKVTSYEGNLSPLWYDIIPLFYLTGSTDAIQVQAISDISLSSSSPALSDISWNIVWESGWISGNGLFDETTQISVKTLSASNSIISTQQNIETFLSWVSSWYLVLFNPRNSWNITYTLTSSDEFSTPRANIISRAKVGKYRQNVQTTLDNTQYLNTLKYAIYGR